jgi:hypothetical protein
VTREIIRLAVPAVRMSTPQPDGIARYEPCWSGRQKGLNDQEDANRGKKGCDCVFKPMIGKPRQKSRRPTCSHHTAHPKRCHFDHVGTDRCERECFSTDCERGRQRNRADDQVHRHRRSCRVAEPAGQHRQAELAAAEANEPAKDADPCPETDRDDRSPRGVHEFAPTRVHPAR